MQWFVVMAQKIKQKKRLLHTVECKYHFRKQSTNAEAQKPHKNRVEFFNCQKAEKDRKKVVYVDMQGAARIGLM